jgi:hypothetical protein
MAVEPIEFCSSKVLDKERRARGSVFVKTKPAVFLSKFGRLFRNVLADAVEGSGIIRDSIFDL